MYFQVTGHCKQCGSPIWIPDKWTRNDCPPPVTYSCACYSPATLIIDPDIKKRLEKLEKEVESLRKAVKPYQEEPNEQGVKSKKSLLKD